MFWADRWRAVRYGFTLSLILFSFWRSRANLLAFQALFLFTLIMTAILAGVQLGSGALQGTPGVRKSNVGFTMAVVLLGVGQLFFGFFTWRFWFIYYISVFNVWAFANGVTWAVDGGSCRQVSVVDQIPVSMCLGKLDTASLLTYRRHSSWMRPNAHTSQLPLYLSCYVYPSP